MGDNWRYGSYWDYSEATISLIKIETASMKVDTFICNDLDSLMDLMSAKDKDYSYSVAWIDSLHKNSRGVLTCGTCKNRRYKKHKKRFSLIQSKECWECWKTYS